MEEKYYEIRKKVIDELEIIKEKKIQNKKIKINLHVMPDNEQEGGASGFTYYDFNNGTLEADIFIIFNDQYITDDHDKRVIEKYNIKNEEHLIYWIFYHELGHIFDLFNNKNKIGLRKTKKRINVYLNKTRKIRIKVNSNQITNEEGENMYREIKEERIADKFANNYYKLRKKFL